MYYVYSRSLVTGKVNHGTQAFPKAEAQAFADELNADPNYKNYLIHWIEAAEQSVHPTNDGRAKSDSESKPAVISG